MKKDKMKKEIIKAINKEEHVEKGMEIYNKIKDKLLPEHKGEVVTIEVDSGDYFIADDVHESLEKARKKYSNKVFFTMRIGYRALWRM